MFTPMPSRGVGDGGAEEEIISQQMRVVRATPDPLLRRGLARSLVLLLPSKNPAKNLHSPSRSARMSLAWNASKRSEIVEELCRQIDYSLYLCGNIVSYLNKKLAKFHRTFRGTRREQRRKINWSWLLVSRGYVGETRVIRCTSTMRTG